MSVVSGSLIESNAFIQANLEHNIMLLNQSEATIQGPIQEFWLVGGGHESGADISQKILKSQMLSDEF